MVRDVTDEEEHRRRAGREHEALVRLNPALPDEDVADQKKDAAQRIQRCVERRKDLDGRHSARSVALTRYASLR
jgi:hypothetical protein